MNKNLKSIVSKEMKTKMMVNREERIERLKKDIIDTEKKIEDEEEILEEEYNRIINKELSSLSKVFSEMDLNITLDKFVNMIDNGEISIKKNINDESNNDFRSGRNKKDKF